MVPVFGLANAGVPLDGETLRAAADLAGHHRRRAWPCWWATTIGITAGAAVALRTGWGILPGGVRWSHLMAGATLAGIGFTISLFIADLAFDDERLKEQATIGILAGSVIAAVAGVVLLRVLGERFPLCSPETEGPPSLPPRPWVDPAVRPEPCDGAARERADLDPAVVRLAVDEDGRGAGDALVEPGGEVGLHLVGELLRGLATTRSPSSPSSSAYARRSASLSRSWRAKSRSCIGQNAPWRAGGLGGQRGGQRVRMHVGQREVAEHQPHPAVGLLDQLPQHGRGGGAVRALEVAVLDDRDRGVGIAEDVLGAGLGRRSRVDAGRRGRRTRGAARSSRARTGSVAITGRRRPDVVERGPHQGAAQAGHPGVGVDLGVGER